MHHILTYSHTEETTEDHASYTDIVMLREQEYRIQEYKNTIVVYLIKKNIHLCQHQYSVKQSF